MSTVLRVGLFKIPATSYETTCNANSFVTGDAEANRIEPGEFAEIQQAGYAGLETWKAATDIWTRAGGSSVRAPVGYPYGEGSSGLRNDPEPAKLGCAVLYLHTPTHASDTRKKIDYFIRRGNSDGDVLYYPLVNTVAEKGWFGLGPNALEDTNWSKSCEGAIVFRITIMKDDRR